MGFIYAPNFINKKNTCRLFYENDFVSIWPIMVYFMFDQCKIK